MSNNTLLNKILKDIHQSRENFVNLHSQKRTVSAPHENNYIDLLVIQNLDLGDNYQPFRANKLLSHIDQINRDPYGAVVLGGNIFTYYTPSMLKSALMIPALQDVYRERIREEIKYLNSAKSVEKLSPFVKKFMLKETGTLPVYYDLDAYDDYSEEALARLEQKNAESLKSTVDALKNELKYDFVTNTSANLYQKVISYMGLNVKSLRAMLMDKNIEKAKAILGTIDKRKILGAYRGTNERRMCTENFDPTQKLMDALKCGDLCFGDKFELDVIMHNDWTRNTDQTIELMFTHSDNATNTFSAVGKKLDEQKSIGQGKHIVVDTKSARAYANTKRQIDSLSATHSVASDYTLISVPGYKDGYNERTQYKPKNPCNTDNFIIRASVVPNMKEYSSTKVNNSVIKDDYRVCVELINIYALERENEDYKEKSVLNNVIFANKAYIVALLNKIDEVKDLYKSANLKDAMTTYVNKLAKDSAKKDKISSDTVNKNVKVSKPRIYTDVIVEDHTL